MKLNKTIIDRDPIEVEEETAYESKKTNQFSGQYFQARHMWEVPGVLPCSRLMVPILVLISIIILNPTTLSMKYFKEVIHNPLSTFQLM